LLVLRPLRGPAVGFERLFRGKKVELKPY